MLLTCGRASWAAAWLAGLRWPSSTRLCHPGFLCQLRIFEENGFDTTKEKVQWNFSNFTEMARTGEMARLHRELMSQMP